MLDADRMKGKVAIVGVGYSPLLRDSGRSVGSLALEAGRNAILDSGVERDAIDGVGGVYSLDIPTVAPSYVAEGLGLSGVTWSYGGFPPSMLPIIEGAAAVTAGLCNYALIVHAKYRWDVTSSSAKGDPMRETPQSHPWDSGFTHQYNAPYKGTVYGPAGMMRRHMYQHGSERRHYGMIAVNNRTNAQRNERAVFRAPLQLEEYLDSPPIFDPFCLYDMDVPIDGAMAVLLTSTERAKDLAKPPVLIEAMAMGLGRRNELSANFKLEQYHETFGLVTSELWRATGMGPADIDIANIYDGFSILAMTWIEAAFTGPGGGPKLLDESWDPATGQLCFWGRVPMSPHGGNLSEGRVQGFGHINEAVLQLRGMAGPTQVAGASTALVTNGIPGSCAGMILTTG